MGGSTFFNQFRLIARDVLGATAMCREIQTTVVLLSRVDEANRTGPKAVTGRTRTDMHQLIIETEFIS